MNRDIRLQVEGSLLEKLLQRALQDGATFARVLRVGPRCMIVEGDVYSAEKLTALCKKYGYACKLLHRGGKTALLDRLRQRWTVFPGLLLGAILCALFFSRVWLVDVEFTGESAQLGSRAEILACLQENGVRPGISRADVDTALLQKQLLASAPDISHAGVRLQGIRLLAEVSPEAPAPDLYEIGYARDLVALRNGVIDTIDVYSGQACVKIGDTVLRGDTLIRGEENVAKNSETGENITAPVGALGKVTARCWFEGSAEASLNTTLQVRTGNMQTAARISLLGLSIPISECEGYACEEIENESLPIVGLFLPLQVERRTHWETTEKNYEADRAILETRLTALARADALRKISAEVKEYEITSSWTDAILNGNTLHIRAVYEISTDIASERDALIEEVY